MNGSYGDALAAFDRLGVWALWAGVVLMVVTIGVLIWVAMRCER